MSHIVTASAQSREDFESLPPVEDLDAEEIIGDDDGNNVKMLNDIFVPLAIVDQIVSYIPSSLEQQVKLSLVSRTFQRAAFRDVYWRSIWTEAYPGSTSIIRKHFRYAYVEMKALCKQNPHALKSTKKKILCEVRAVLLGIDGSGKSSLANRFAQTSTYNLDQTEHVYKREMFYNGQKYMLEVIDTVSSQDELNNPKWMKEANAILLVCSLTSKKSLKGLGYYINMRKRLEIDAPIILVASKLDKVGERKLTKEELQEFAIKNNIDHVFETSAASNENVTQTFIVLARHAFYNYNFANIWKKIAKGESVRDTKIDHKNKCILS